MKSLSVEERMIESECKNVLPVWCKSEIICNNISTFEMLRIVTELLQNCYRIVTEIPDCMNECMSE